MSSLTPTTSTLPGEPLNSRLAFLLPDSVPVVIHIFIRVQFRGCVTLRHEKPPPNNFLKTVMI